MMDGFGLVDKPVVMATTNAKGELMNRKMLSRLVLGPLFVLAAATCSSRRVGLGYRRWRRLFAKRALMPTSPGVCAICSSTLSA